MSEHPNALAGGSSGGIGIAIVALVHRVFGVELTPEEAGLIVVAAATLGLLIGRNGLRGLARILWRGSS